MPVELIINEELALQLNLLSYIDTEYVSDVILALFEGFNGIKQDPEDMPQPVKMVFNYWNSKDKLTQIMRVNDDKLNR